MSAPALRPAPVDQVATGPDLLALLGTGDVTSVQVRDVKTILLAKRQLVIVELEGKKARAAYLQQAFDKASAETERAIQRDDAISDLNVSLALIRQQITFAEQTNASPRDIALLRTEISRQVCELEERQERIRMCVGAGSLPEMVRCRIENEAEVQDLKTQLASLDTQLAALDKAQPGAK